MNVNGKVLELYLRTPGRYTVDMTNSCTYNQTTTSGYRPNTVGSNQRFPEERQLESSRNDLFGQSRSSSCFNGNASQRGDVVLPANGDVISCGQSWNSPRPSRTLSSGYSSRTNGNVTSIPSHSCEAVHADIGYCGSERQTSNPGSCHFAFDAHGPAWGKRRN